MIPIPGGATTIIAGVALVAVTSYALHCEHVKKDRAAFIAKLEAQAEEQKREVARLTAENLQRKDKADAETKRLRANLADAAQRLRDNVNTDPLPPAAPGADRTDRACFSRADLSRALSEFATGAAEIAVSSDECRAALDIAKSWAQGTRP